jgi:hypothetical protein
LPAKDHDMRSPSRQLLFVVVLAFGGTFVAPAAEAKPKARRVQTEAVQRAVDSDEDADAAALSGRVNGTSQYTKFEDEVVEGQTDAPGGVNVVSRGDVTMKSLLRIRGHFLPELVRMATDV